MARPLRSLLFQSPAGSVEDTSLAVRRRAVMASALRKMAGSVWFMLVLFVPLLSVAAEVVSANSQPIAVRSGNHPDYGRVVFDTPPGTSYIVTRDGDRLTMVFPDGIILSAPPATPRNIISIESGAARAELVIAPRTTFRAARLGSLIVIDVFDPVPSGAAAAITASIQRQAKPPAPGPAESNSGAAQAPAKQQEPQTPAAAAAPVKPAEAAIINTPGAAPTAMKAQAPGSVPPAAAAPQLSADAADGGPVALLAHRAAPPAGTKGAAFAVPFTNAVGAAVFSHGANAFVVFDERRPLDLAALRLDPVFASASVQLLPSGTLIRLQPPPGLTPALLQSQKGWTVALLPSAPHLATITPDIAPDHVRFSAEQPNDVVAVADPDSGATWLVGTQRQPGQRIATARLTGEFALLPTGLGIAVEPLADSIALRVVPGGFELTGAHAGLAVSPQPKMADVLSAAARLTRRFDFSPMPTQALVQQMTRQIAAAATAPPQARGPKRRAAAMTMIALGLNAEAEALLQIAAEDDPREAASPETAGLKAIAAMLAGRPAEADALADPRLTGTDDIVMWRSIRLALADETSPEAASGFLATAPLAFALPPAIRDHVLPVVMETMVQGGQQVAAGKLLAQRPHDPRLGFARALLAQANGDTEAALRLYDALANNRDQLDRARAAWRAVELRLTSQKIDTRQAADDLDKLLYVWRGDRRDLALRERLAELRMQSGRWRTSLSVLRDAAADFPDHAAEIRERLRATFAKLLSDDNADALQPLDLIAVMDENADLLPTTAEGDAMKLRLADKLLALDLPQRADPLLDRLMQAAPAGEGRAGLGARLARLRLHEGNADGTLKALEASSAENLSPPLFETRALLAAVAFGKRGDAKAAIAALLPLSTAAADEARATLMEQTDDWPAAEKALTDYVGKIVPDIGELDDNQRQALLRLTTAAARAGDTAALADLRTRMGSRIGSGPLADMFRLLTADPVRGVSDLPRAKQEVGFARTLTAGLNALRPAAMAH
jgi:hypothetical protein